jgi:hypothetical protein
MEHWVRDLISWLTILFHTVREDNYVIFVDPVFQVLEEAWPLIQGYLEEYFDEREVFYQILKAQDEGFEIVWEDEEDLDVLD